MTCDESIGVFDEEGLERLRKQHRLDPQYIRVLRNNLFKKFLSDETAVSDFPAASQLKCHVLELFQSVDSEVDGATKLLFRTAEQMLIESVILRIASGRTTLCVSSQVGCAAACDFCATGKMGIARNLSAADLLDQVLQAGQYLNSEGRRLDNIVFMGMGEPFHNEDNLHAVLDALTSPKLFDRSPGSLLVSTVGIPDAMLRCAKRYPRVNLALSLHSADQNVRESIIPLAKKHPLQELRRTLEQVNDVHQRDLMIEYLMLRDVNDSSDAAHQLVDWLQGLRVHVNLIPYNAIDDAPHLVATDKAEIAAFASIMKDAGFRTTVRYSLGNDVAAACGQLVRRENRQHAVQLHSATTGNR